MSLQRCSRALLSGATVLRSVSCQQIRRKSQICTHTRSLNLAAAAKTLLEPPPAGTAVVGTVTGTNTLRVGFSDGSAKEIPYTWLRGNCRCHRCLRGDTEGRLASGEQSTEIHPEIVQSNVHGIVVDWSDGHISKYPGLWLYEKATSSVDQPVLRQQQLCAV
ncbi:trimethyllysine dioxygenase-like [Penaeus monodon]|uniref:trimethyllysine dioxygenase-like n=1 Tax=Penaeus monodon TaxID=6687 RepID=UPI0018A6D612|nr:trimethyllysine dioxygenase-like [Penaeus monodon]